MIKLSWSSLSIACVSVSTFEVQVMLALAHDRNFPQIDTLALSIALGGFLSEARVVINQMQFRDS